MKCPNCSGTLVFDIKEQNLKCRHCSQTFDVKNYKVDASAEELVFEDARFYTCKSCGAQLISGDDKAVEYCTYCGSQAILESNLSGIKNPKYIIPFKITKTKCKDIYRRQLKNKLYIPKEFKDPDFIDRFRPFYIPYWMYQIGFNIDPVVYEKGCAIFRHVKNPEQWGTAGCLSTTEDAMLKILQAGINGAYIIIVPSKEEIGNY